MATLSPAQIYQVARVAGFDPQAAVIWTAIALAESGGNPGARNPNGEDSRGLWQINVAPHVRPNTWGDLYDPLTNARAAFEISGGGTNLQPWTVTHASNQGTNRDYRTYLDEAQIGASQVGEHVAAADIATFTGTSRSASAPLSAAGSPTGGGDGEREGYVQPVAGAKLIDSWHAPRSGGRSHKGIDIMAEEGTPIVAITSGRVVRGFSDDLGGVVVRIEGDDGRFYYYAHLQEGSVDHLQVGQTVAAGEPIGRVGDTGNAKGTSPHLHLGIKEGGEWINPYDFLQDLPDAGDPVPDFALGDDGDADGAGDAYEIAHGLDPTRPDTDGDGLLDGYELRHGLDPTRADSDDDGLSDAYELLSSGTDPLRADTDGDLLPDAAEVRAGSDPTRGTTRTAGATLVDPASPAAQVDTDDDGLSDAYEISLGTDPAVPDTDGDGLLDGVEIHQGTNPLAIDSDADGFSDHAEVTFGSDPLTPDDPFGSTEPLAPALLGAEPPGAGDHDHDLDGDDVDA